MKVEEARKLLADAVASGRSLSEAQLKACKRVLNDDAMGQQMRKVLDGDGGADGGEYITMTDSRGDLHGAPGDVFIRSSGFKSIADSQTRGQRWSTGAVEVGSLSTKGTLLLGTGAPGTGTGGGLVPTPQVIPGVVDKLFQPIAVADLLPSAQTNTNTLRYINEGTATSGAAGVAEGGTKPESTLGYSTVDEPVRKVATVIVTSDELLEDAVNVQSYLNGRLSLFVQLEEERQLLRGGGTTELVGIFNRSGLATYGRGTADNNAVAILKAIAGNRGSTNLEPDAVVMHPQNWLSTRLLTDANGQFFGGGPYSGSYGNGSQTGLFGDSLWNKRVVLSNHVGVGTALIGSFSQAAQVFRRGGPTLEVSNSHEDLFVHDMMAIRCESRLALCVYRESSFVQVVGLS